MIIRIHFSRIVNSHGSMRLASYMTIWVAYLAFMSRHSPRGIEWLPWHLQRIYNAVQYVKVNGYFYSNGFSIWSTCKECSYSASEWIGNIYLSSSVFKLFPYIFLNHFWGFEALQKFGPIVDRMAIFIAAAAAAELSIICLDKYGTLPKYFVGSACFLLFATTPWTYRMLLSSWLEIYFLPLLLLALLFFYHGRNATGCLLLFCASWFHYQWAVALVGFYGLFFLGSYIFKCDEQAKKYLPTYGNTIDGMVVIIFSIIFSPLFEGVLRWMALQDIVSASGSSLLYRMGISGVDIHNGGLLGALQFLGGNRVTVCLADYGSGTLIVNLTDGIARYNCILSIGSMLLLSVAAIAGLIILIKKSEQAKWIVFPLVYALLIFITFLQQSLSAHLMGYSFIFSFLFALGIVSVMAWLTEFIHSLTLRIALSVPSVLGIVFLMIRVSMLTGANG